MANSKLKGNEIVNIPPHSELIITVQGEANFLALNEVKPLIPDNDNTYTTIHFKLLFEGLIVGDGVIKTGEFFQLSNTPFNQIALSTHNHEFYKGKAIIATISYGAGIFNDTSTEFANKELPIVVSELKTLNSRIGTGEFSLNGLNVDVVRKLNSVERISQNIETATQNIERLVSVDTNTEETIANNLQYILFTVNKLNNKTVSDFPYKSETKSLVAVNEYITFNLAETDLISIDFGMNKLANYQVISYQLEFSKGGDTLFEKLGTLVYNNDGGDSNTREYSTETINNTFHTTKWTKLKVKVIYKTGSTVSRLYCNVNSFKK